MYSTGSNDRAAKGAFEYATPGASWDELAYEERNRWRNIAFAARVAAGDVMAPDMRARKASDPWSLAPMFYDPDLAG
ncbi:MAG TPA: hypothetical protein VK162_20170 [Streptosporangiaceae bacterium]|nr:hypothetical protein [Streptosporangiaceae bacterium]